MCDWARAKPSSPDVFDEEVHLVALQVLALPRFFLYIAVVCINRSSMINI